MSDPATAGKKGTPKNLMILGITDAEKSPYNPAYGNICKVWGTVSPPSAERWHLQLLKILNFEKPIGSPVPSGDVQKVKTQGTDMRDQVDSETGGDWVCRELSGAKCQATNTVVVVATWQKYMVGTLQDQVGLHQHSPNCQADCSEIDK